MRKQMHMLIWRIRRTVSRSSSRFMLCLEWSIVEWHREMAVRRTWLAEWQDWESNRRYREWKWFSRLMPMDSSTFSAWSKWKNLSFNTQTDQSYEPDENQCLRPWSLVDYTNKSNVLNSMLSVHNNLHSTLYSMPCKSIFHWTYSGHSTQRKDKFIRLNSFFVFSLTKCRKVMGRFSGML